MSTRTPSRPRTGPCASAESSRPPGAGAAGCGRGRPARPAARSGSTRRRACGDLGEGNPDTALLPAAARRASRRRPGTTTERPVLYGQAPVDAGAGAARPRRAGRRRGAGRAARRHLRIARRHRAGARPPTSGPVTPSPSRTRAGAACWTWSRPSGCGPCPSALDDDGPLPRGGGPGAGGRGARALIVTDRAQNPTGAVVAPRARARAARPCSPGIPRTLLIEDDHGHAHRRPAAAPPRRGHGPLGARTLRRQGVRPRSAARRAHRRRRHRRPGPGRQSLGPGWVSRLLQRAVVRAVDVGRGRPARRWRVPTGERRDALLGRWRERGVEAHGRSGMNVWVPVADETGAVARLLHAGWAVAPGARFRISVAAGRAAHGVRPDRGRHRPARRSGGLGGRPGAPRAVTADRRGDPPAAAGCVLGPRPALGECRARQDDQRADRGVPAQLLAEQCDAGRRGDDRDEVRDHLARSSGRPRRPGRTAAAARNPCPARRARPRRAAARPGTHSAAW